MKQFFLVLVMVAGVTSVTRAADYQFTRTLAPSPTNSGLAVSVDALLVASRNPENTLWVIRLVSWQASSVYTDGAPPVSVTNPNAGGKVLINGTNSLFNANGDIFSTSAGSVTVSADIYTNSGPYSGFYSVAGGSATWTFPPAPNPARASFPVKNPYSKDMNITVYGIDANGDYNVIQQGVVRAGENVLLNVDADANEYPQGLSVSGIFTETALNGEGELVDSPGEFLEFRLGKVGLIPVASTLATGILPTQTFTQPEDVPAEVGAVNGSAPPQSAAISNYSSNSTVIYSGAASASLDKGTMAGFTQAVVNAVREGSADIVSAVKASGGSSTGGGGDPLPVEVDLSPVVTAVEDLKDSLNTDHSASIASGRATGEAGMASAMSTGSGLVPVALDFEFSEPPSGTFNAEFWQVSLNLGLGAAAAAVIDLNPDNFPLLLKVFAFVRTLAGWMLVISCGLAVIKTTEWVVGSVATMQPTTAGSSGAVVDFAAGALPASIWKAGVITAAVFAVIPLAYGLFNGDLLSISFIEAVSGTGGGPIFDALNSADTAVWAVEGVKLANAIFPLSLAMTSVVTVIVHKLTCQSIVLGLSSAIRWAVG